MPSVAGIRLVEGPNISGHRIQQSDAHHLLVIDETVVPCTPTEYVLLMSLLQRVGAVQSFATLLGLSEQQTLNRHLRRTLTQHMSRLRAKLWPFGLDIRCLTGYGYLLLVGTQEQRDDA